MIWNFYVNTCGCSRLIPLGLHFFIAFFGILLVLLYRKSCMPGPTRSYASDHLLERIWYMYVQHWEVKVHGFYACYVINVNFIHSCARCVQEIRISWLPEVWQCVSYCLQNIQASSFSAFYTQAQHGRCFFRSWGRGKHTKSSTLYVYVTFRAQ